MRKTNQDAKREAFDLYCAMRKKDEAYYLQMLGEQIKRLAAQEMKEEAREAKNKETNP